MAALTWVAALVAALVAAVAAARAVLGAGLAAVGAALLSTLGQRSDLWAKEAQYLQFLLLERGGI